MFTDRFMMFFHTGDGSLRGVSFLFGLNLILAGLIIFFFPEVLVFVVSFALVASGVSVMIAGWRHGRHGGHQYSIWE